MNKSQYLYNLSSEFESNKEILDLKRHYTAETLDTKNIHFKNYNIKPEDVIKPVSESIAADICIVDNNTLEKYIVDGNSYSVDIFPLEQYTPIGVVVVPGSHTDDGTARIISLVAMDYNNPDNGNIEGNVNIFFGGANSGANYGYNILDLKDCCYSPKIILDTGGTFEETQRIIEWVKNAYYLASDYYFGTSYEGATNPYDIGACWGSGDFHDWGCPSPYLNDGSKNPLYSQVYDDGSGIGNMVEQMDGRINTETILDIDNERSIDWQTAATITNTGRTETIHPAAQCCWRYHTIGTSQGDWYLPSAGELGYLASRWKAINASIAKIINFGFGYVLSLTFYNYLSSTESDTDSSVYLSFYADEAKIQDNYKFNLYAYTRAFLAV